MVKHNAYQDCVLQLGLLQETLDHIPDGSSKQRMTGVNLYSCPYDQPKEGANLAHSRLNNDFEMEVARGLPTLFADPQPATVVAAISARRLFLAREVPLRERNLCVNKSSKSTNIVGSSEDGMMLVWSQKFENNA